MTGVRAGFGGAKHHGLAALGAVRDGIRRIGLIGRIGRIAAALPLLKPCRGQLFGVAALLDEGLLEGGELLVEEVVGLVDEADDGVGAHGAGFRAFRRPLGQVAVEEEVFVVEEELFEAGTGGVEQAELGLRRGGGEPATFGNILAATARSHEHLVGEARAGVEEFFAEPVGGVVDERGGLEAGGGAVAAGGAEALAGRGADGSVGSVRSVG